VDPTNSDALEIAGVNNRYNSITIDGVRQSDDFGLNNNGYPTQRSPLSIDAIEAVSILTAPFSVEYGHFRGSTINVVTKSGTNEFSGSGFYYSSDNSLVGDRSKDRNLTFTTFEDETYGGTFGGPIFKDKLFFFVSYEKLESTEPQDFGPTGSGFPVEVPGISQADYDRILQVTNDVYGFDPGIAFNQLLEEDEKLLAKIDWNITDAHRASFSYQHTEGNEVVTVDNSSGARTLGTPSHWYNRSVDMDSYSMQLFSDWNEWLSTEFKAARKEIITGQVPLFGTAFSEMQITTTGGGRVFIGPDFSRHANALTNDLDLVKLKGNVFLGDHTLTVGLEREMLDIFNLFVQQSRGVYEFTSVDNYENRTANRLIYNNAFTNDANDAAATFGYDVTSFYVQDEWQVSPDLKLQAGVRLDKFSSSDEPLFNQNFASRYGFTNQATLDGRDLIQPRLGFNWQWRPETTIYGGWGLFGGGTPNVWISNSFTNNGVIISTQDIRPTTADVVCNGQTLDLADGLMNIDGFNINAEVLANQTCLRGDGQVNVTDPDFEIPSQYRWNLGIKHTLPWDVEMTADVVFSRVKDEVLWRDIRLVQTGTAPDGRPIYVTRADRSPCNPGQVPGADGLCTRPSGGDLLLTNTSEGEGTVFTIDFSKTWRTRGGRFDAYMAYGYQDIKDVNSGTSSTALSNWDSFAVSDPNNPGLETSNYEIEHLFKGAFTWRKAFFGDYETSVALVGERRAGRPFSYTFGAGSTLFGDPRQAARQRHLLYVPAATGAAGDVIYEAQCTAADVTAGIAGCASVASFSSANPGAAALRAAMDSFIDQQDLEGYRGRIVPRNSGRSPWLSTLDLRFAQELPIWGRARGELTLDIENFANMINSDWGQLRQVSFIYVAPVIDANRIVAAGCPGGAASCYVYRPRAGTTGPTAPVNSLTALPSVWKIQLGVRFEF
jgi:hypothetical protein